MNDQYLPTHIREIHGMDAESPLATIIGKHSLDHDALSENCKEARMACPACSHVHDVYGTTYAQSLVSNPGIIMASLWHQHA